MNPTIWFLLTLLIVLPLSGFCLPTLVLPSRSLVIKLPRVNATIPCSYTFPENVTTITWSFGGVGDRTVLQKSSDGKVKAGHGYERLVSLGEGCSLVFKSASLANDGNYTITIHHKSESSETVRVVFVVGENATVFSSGDNKSSPTGSNTTKTTSESDNSTGWIVVTVIAVVGLILALILVGVMFHEVPENRTWVRNTCLSCSSCCSQSRPVPTDEPDN